ncbi:MAG: type II toxin-antitoxin system RelE/ParE family toxin [Acidovorax sp.]|uniref:type II toxin-antitoxin system RelE/ParE family toxin n=1 Tax=Acidovorax sp. TaxID=1872122 RepID=UPI0039E70C9F
MARSIVILGSAKEEFKAIKSRVKSEFGDNIWNTVNAEYKKAFDRIQNRPELGRHIDELRDLGVANVRYRLVRQTRVVYEFDDAQAIVHMFIHTRRDFRTHLLQRLLHH